MKAQFSPWHVSCYSHARTFLLSRGRETTCHLSHFRFMIGATRKGKAGNENCSHPRIRRMAMSGKGNVRFSELFASTVEVHGFAFAHDYYVTKHGMPEWEYRFWADSLWIAE